MNEFHLHSREMQKALRLRKRFGPALPMDGAIQGLFDVYLDLIRETDSLMADSGVVEACSCCAKAKGSCCFDGMDESYSALSLYVNMLMGSELSFKAEFPNSCRQAGSNGCGLKARHAFCLNYFCPELQSVLGESKVGSIQRSVGLQLLAGWELERALAKVYGL